MQKRKQAFTLIELIVVMAILAILVMIAAGAYLGYTKKAQQTRLMHDARLVEDAVERYHLDHGEFPIDESRPIKGRDLVDPRDKNWNPVTPDPDKDYYPIDEDKIDDYVNIGTDPDHYIVDPDTGDVIIIPDPNITPGNNNDDENPGEEFQPLPENEIDDLVNEGWIPVANADELNQIRLNGEILTFGKGTKWEGLYESGLDKFYIQVANINLSSYSAGEGWEPLGNSEEGYFSGQYNGANYKISNLYINRPYENSQGLFGVVEIIDPSYSIKNIVIQNANVTGDACIGALAGEVYGEVLHSIENVHIKNSTIAATGDYIGGLFGYLWLSDAHSFRKISATDTKVSTVEGGAGGLVGFLEVDSIGYIENLKADKVEVTATECIFLCFTGALIGDFEIYDHFDSVKNLSVTNSKVSSITAGGAFGFAFIYYGGTVEDISIKNTEVINPQIPGDFVPDFLTSEDSFMAGGFAGLFETDADVIRNVVIDNVKVFSPSSAGGLAGTAWTDHDMEFDGLDIINCLLEGENRIGLILGAISSDDTVTVRNSRITGNTYSGDLLGGNVDDSSGTIVRIS
jgi:prepilin-type N-terminal cleavage/methylation domain-containing protein